MERFDYKHTQIYYTNNQEQPTTDHPTEVRKTQKYANSHNLTQAITELNQNAITLMKVNYRRLHIDKINHATQVQQQSRTRTPLTKHKCAVVNETVKSNAAK